MYHLYDTEGNLKESGIMPSSPSDITTRATWNGITLYNGETLAFTNTNGQPWSCSAGDYWICSYDLSRAVHTQLKFNYHGTNGIWQWSKYYDSYSDFVGRTGSFPENGLYYWSLKNFSSDPVTINYFAVDF